MHCRAAARNAALAPAARRAVPARAGSAALRSSPHAPAACVRRRGALHRSLAAQPHGVVQVERQAMPRVRAAWACGHAGCVAMALPGTPRALCDCGVRVHARTHARLVSGQQKARLETAWAALCNHRQCAAQCGVACMPLRCKTLCARCGRHLVGRHAACVWSRWDGPPPPDVVHAARRTHVRTPARYAPPPPRAACVCAAARWSARWRGAWIGCCLAPTHTWPGARPRVLCAARRSGSVWRLVRREVPRVAVAQCSPCRPANPRACPQPTTLTHAHASYTRVGGV